MPRILFAEDEPVHGKLVKAALERERDFTVEWVKNGKEALEAFNTTLPAVCILDVMMPLLDGFTLAGTIRAKQRNLPILFLTARSETSDVIKGFKAGGNDYLKKPFSIDELVLRVRELLRRTVQPEVHRITNPNHFKIGYYHFNANTQVLRCTKAEYHLSAKENELLKELAICKNSLLERQATLLKLWGVDNACNARNMDVYISRLRKFLIHDPAISIINIRGYGYKLIVEPG